MWDLKLFCIYPLYSHEKNYVFSMWDLKPISIYNLYSHEKKCRIWNLLVYILYVSKKKVKFFQCGIKNFFGLNTST